MEEKENKTKLSLAPSHIEFPVVRMISKENSDDVELFLEIKGRLKEKFGCNEGLYNQMTIGVDFKELTSENYFFNLYFGSVLPKEWKILSYKDLEFLSKISGFENFFKKYKTILPELILNSDKVSEGYSANKEVIDDFKSQALKMNSEISDKSCLIFPDIESYVNVNTVLPKIKKPTFYNFENKTKYPDLNPGSFRCMNGLLSMILSRANLSFSMLRNYIHRGENDIYKIFIIGDKYKQAFQREFKKYSKGIEGILNE